MLPGRAKHCVSLQKVSEPNASCLCKGKLCTPCPHTLTTHPAHTLPTPHSYTHRCESSHCSLPLSPLPSPPHHSSPLPSSPTPSSLGQTRQHQLKTLRCSQLIVHIQRVYLYLRSAIHVCISTGTYVCIVCVLVQS